MVIISEVKINLTDERHQHVYCFKIVRFIPSFTDMNQFISVSKNKNFSTILILPLFKLLDPNWNLSFIVTQSLT